MNNHRVSENESFPPIAPLLNGSSYSHNDTNNQSLTSNQVLGYFDRAGSAIPAAVAVSGVVFCAQGDESTVQRDIENAFFTSVAKDHLLSFESTSLERSKTQSPLRRNRKLDGNEGVADSSKSDGGSGEAENNRNQLDFSSTSKIAHENSISQHRQRRKMREWGPQRLFVCESAAAVADSYPIVPSKKLRCIVQSRAFAPIACTLISIMVLLPFLTGVLVANNPRAYTAGSAASASIGILIFGLILTQYSRDLIKRCLWTFDFWFMMSELVTFTATINYINYSVWEGIPPTVLIVLTSTSNLLWSTALFALDASTMSRRLKGVVMTIAALAMAGQAYRWGTSESPVAKSILEWHPFKPDLRTLASGAAFTLVCFFARYAIGSFFPSLGGDMMLINFSPREVKLNGIQMARSEKEVEYSSGGQEVDAYRIQDEYNRDSQIQIIDQEVEMKKSVGGVVEGREDGGEGPSLNLSSDSRGDNNGSFAINISARLLTKEEQRARGNSPISFSTTHPRPFYVEKKGWEIPLDYELVKVETA